ncbi:IS3 family transposase [Bifidobacterium longum]|uniref:IS3 family transposase n=1 Tax=Bifidobacterium longum TaxID=216816 RepID=UPI0038BBC7EC
MPVDRLRPRYSLRSMACLLRIAPSSYHYHHARIGVDKYAGLRARVARAFADSKGRYGYRRVKAALGTGVSEKVIRRIMAEGGLSAHVPKRRRYSSYEGETTPAPGNLVNRDFTAERPNEKWLTDITEIKARDGKVYLSPMIDCHDGKIVAYTACFHPNAASPTGCSPRRRRRCPTTPVPWSIPTGDATTGGPDGWSSWNATG